MKNSIECCVIGCNNLSRFTFPKNPAVRKAWLEAIRRPDFVPKHKYGLCMDHFKKEDVCGESYTGGYKTERVVLRRHIVPSIFPWTKSETLFQKKEKKVIRNVGNTVIIKREDPKEIEFESNYNQCLENLVGSPFQTVFIKSEGFELSDTDNSQGKIIDKIGINESVKNFQVNKVIVKDAQSGIATSSHCTNRPVDFYASRFYSKIDIKLREHDYHAVKPRSPPPPKLTGPRYDIDQFQEDSKAIKVFTGLGNYDIFEEVMQGLGDKIYNLKYCGNRSTGKLSVKNQLFLVLWKLKRDCSDFDLSRHFNIPIVAVGNIFRTWVRFFGIERPKVEIRNGKEIFEYYRLKRYEQYYAPTPVAPNEPVDGEEEQDST